MTTITEDYVSFEVAKLLKEKGFSEPVHYDYHYTITVPQFHKKAHNFNGEEYANCETEWFSAPTLQMAMKWLREVHHLHITVFSSSQESWMYRITKPHQTLEEGCYGEDYTSYEEACEAAIKYCLENLI